ncbi:MAG: 2-oxoacid:acceptor oxidoreductase subunit alpha [Deltaproteobacteria bacterium]|nr:2-oxoacid:acceptor oxidoreductase subunit alpha [Deltaproteobacteria bacterium]
MRHTEKILHLTLVGSGGDGVMSTASMLLRTAARMGLYGMMTQSYGPQIRGGESAAHVTIGVEPVAITGVVKDLIVCFRFEYLSRFAQEITAAPHVALFHSAEETDIPVLLQTKEGMRVPIPFQQILEEAGLPEIAKNVVVFGMVLRALGWDLGDGNACVSEVFSHKSSAVISSNLRALEVGYQHLETLTLPFRGPRHGAAKQTTVISGNEACAEAAVDAGCRFYAGYPITPSSEILEKVYELFPAVGGRLVQAEDEIAAIGMIIGASWGGVKSMTATSGPGLSLMTEMLGLASMAEIPVVIVDCQRAGPATGLPSRMEQSDLWHAIYGGHGDFPRVVLAPTNIRDCYLTMFRAFHLAETYQLPVLVLSDANIAQRSEIIEKIDTRGFPRGERAIAALETPGDIDALREGIYRRFDLAAAVDDRWPGVNPVAIPGMPGGMHSIAGIEHTERGTPSADGANHERMNQKRFRKLMAIERETAEWCVTSGRAKAPIGLIAWGSCAGVVQEYALTRDDIALFVPHMLHPFPARALQTFLEGRRTVGVIEMNFQGQLYHHLRGIGVLDGTAHNLRRSGGLPFQLDEIGILLREGGLI